ncbi:hypothetical protein A0256_05315 [Mucilaginibacter sp. PAMC 26640]|nr:hypothetical protein A0256_05315 [Mucilaginibacter sp. PAMC 26640]
MKNLYAISFVIFVALGLTAFAPDSFLLPESFYLHKGDKMSVHLLSGDNLNKEDESRYNSKKTTKFNIYEGSKMTDLLKVAKDSATPVLDYTVNGSGMVMVEMNTKDEMNELPHEDFVAYLSKQGYDNLAEKVKDDTRLNLVEKYRYYLKTLVNVDNGGGNAYSKVMGSELEIVLKQNPYKKSYGDDITAIVYFKGKPLKTSNVFLYIKTASGTVHPQLLATDANGQVFFSPSRDGIYMLRCIRIEPSVKNDADFETWVSTFSFAFSNQDELPNTYREFGFGNKH